MVPAVVATKLCQIGGVSGFTFDLPPTPVLLSVWCSPAFDNTSRVCLCAYRTGIGYSGVVAGPVSRGSFPRRSWFGIRRRFGGFRFGVRCPWWCPCNLAQTIQRKCHPPPGKNSSKVLCVKFGSDLMILSNIGIRDPTSILSSRLAPIKADVTSKISGGVGKHFVKTGQSESGILPFVPWLFFAHAANLPVSDSYLSLYSAISAFRSSPYIPQKPLPSE
jgi:hypothetical protein